MSVLTKVFVVLVTVLAIVLVALIIPFVANTQEYQQLLRNERAQRTTAEKTAELRQTEITAIQARDSQQVAELKAQSSVLLGQITQLSTELARSEGDRLAAQQTAAKAQTDVTALTASQEQVAAVLAATSKELTTVREDASKNQSRNSELIQTINERNSQVEVLNREVRNLKEHLTQVSDEYEQLREGVQKLPAEWQVVATGRESTDESPAHEAAPPGIHGAVTDVLQVGEDTFVKVNVGQNDKVDRNMKFLIHRGGKYLGTLIITSVDAEDAAGILRLSQGQVKAGDAVQSGVQ